MDMIYCRTIALNEPVVSFHTSCGLVTHGTVSSNMVRDGKSFDAIEQRLTRANWPKIRAILTAKAERLAERLPGIAPKTGKRA
jgi:hypothetical protein